MGDCIIRALPYYLGSLSRPLSFGDSRFISLVKSGAVYKTPMTKHLKPLAGCHTLGWLSGSMLEGLCAMPPETQGLSYRPMCRLEIS